MAGLHWYFAEGGQRKGPLSEEDFAQQVRMGAVMGDTLVWREGLAEWMPYRQLMPFAGGSPPPLAVPCDECQRRFRLSDTIALLGKRVCGDCKPIVLERMREGFTEDVPYAGFFQRAAARLLDMTILGIAYSSTYYVLYSVSEEPTAAFLAMSMGMNFGFMLLSMLYESFFITKFAATPGKLALGLRVIRPDGTAVTAPRAVGRAFATILSAMFCYVGYLLPLVDENRRALHDMICDTRVVREEAA